MWHSPIRVPAIPPRCRCGTHLWVVVCMVHAMVRWRHHHLLDWPQVVHELRVHPELVHCRNGKASGRVRVETAWEFGKTKDRSSHRVANAVT